MQIILASAKIMNERAVVPEDIVATTPLLRRRTACGTCALMTRMIPYLPSLPIMAKLTSI